MSTRPRPAGAARARVTVDDYDAQPAAEAAIALRRAGLHPALERTFHWGQDTHGLVVAQEPPAGSEVPLDSTVLLFVSAPGERGESDSDTPPQQPSAAPAPEDLAGEHGVPTPAARSRRRRKPRPSPGLTSPTVNATAAGVTGAQPPRTASVEEPTGRVHTCEGADVRVDASEDSSGWLDDDPLLALAQDRLANAASATGAPIPALSSGGVAGVLALAGVTFLVTLVVVLVAGHVHALQAAGAFNGTPISGVQTFVDKLRGNLIWLGGTAMGLVIAVVGIMFMAGHSRAHDLAIRTIVGLAILASISGIVA